MYNQTNLSNISNFTKFTDDDVSMLDESQIESQISNNNRTLNIFLSGLDLLAQQQFSEAAKIFEKGIYFFQQNPEMKNSSYNISLLHCNVSLCQFYMNNLEKCEKELNLASESLNIQNNINNEQFRLLYLKILTSYLVLYLKTKNNSNVKQIINLLEEFIVSEKSNEKRAIYTTQVIYLLFKQDSLIEQQQDNNQQFLTLESQKVKILIDALNEQFQGRQDKAGALLFQALEKYQENEEDLMCLVIVKHLIVLYKNKPQTVEKLEEYYEGLSQNENFDRNQIDQLFEGFEEKILLVQNLVQKLKALEKKEQTKIKTLLDKQEIEKMRIVLLLCLKNSLAKGRRIQDALKREQLNHSLIYIERTVELLQTEQSLVFLSQLQKHPFVQNSMKKLILSICSIFRCINILTFKDSFQKILQVANQNKQKSHFNPKQFVHSKIPIKMTQSKEQIFQIQSKISQNAKEAVAKGDTLVKFNLTSRGYLKKFFKVFNGSAIRWAKKESSLNNIKNCHSYMLNEIRGITYGKCTENFQVSKSARKVEPWLCFSIIFKKRSLDIYCSENQIDNWYIGLSELIKLHNPQAFCLSKGQYYWRKFSLVIKYAVMLNIPSNERKKLKKHISLAKAIILFEALRNPKLAKILKIINECKEEEDTSLQISGIYIGKLTNNIKNDIQTAFDIKSLNISNCRLSSLENIPVMEKVTELILSDNLLNDDSIQQLREFKHIKYLDIAGNRIQELKSLEFLKDFKNLKHLSVEANDFTEEDEYIDKLFDMYENLELVDGINRDGEEVDYCRSDDTEEEDDEEEEGSNNVDDFIQSENEEQQKMQEMKDEIQVKELEDLKKEKTIIKNTIPQPQQEVKEDDKEKNKKMLS